jgi:hypothetical protein
MEVSASLVTDAESLELMQPGEGALLSASRWGEGGAVERATM